MEGYLFGQVKFVYSFSEQFFLYHPKKINAFTQKRAKNDQNIKKGLQKSNLEAFFDIYALKMPSNMIFADSHYPAKLDILEVQRRTDLHLNPEQRTV